MNQRQKQILLAAVLAIGLTSSQADMSGPSIALAVQTVRNAHGPAEVADRNLIAVNQAIARAMTDTLLCGTREATDRLDPAARLERRDAAVAVAAFAVLEVLYPEQREQLESRLAISFSHIPETAAKAEGAELGRCIAEEVLAASR